jgi:hypothetical protein
MGPRYGSLTSFGMTREALTVLNPTSYRSPMTANLLQKGWYFTSLT